MADTHLTDSEPLLVTAMRRADPTDHVRIPGCGTSIGGFLREFDRHVAARLRVQAEQIATAIAAGPSCGLASRDHDGCYVADALRIAREHAPKEDQ